VQSVSVLTNDEYEILAGVVLLVNSGRVRLRGPLADTTLTISTPLFVFPPWLRAALREYQALTAPPHSTARQGRGSTQVAA
jgi:hypothetical protein